MENDVGLIFGEKLKKQLLRQRLCHNKAINLLDK